MTTLRRTAAIAGQSYKLTCKNPLTGALVTPTAPPTATMYTDAARTAGAVALVVTATAQPQVFMVALPVTPAGRRYLKHLIPTVTGVQEDVDDDVEFTAVGAGVDEPVITVAEVKDYLRKEAVATASDTLIASLIDAATQLIEQDATGAIVARSVIERLDGGAAEIVLEHHVVSIASVIEYANGTATVLTEYDASLPAPAHGWLLDGRILSRSAGVRGARFRPGLRNVHVTYVAGFSPVPEPIKHAVREQIKLWWVEGRNGGHAGFTTPGGEQAATQSVTQAGLHPYVRRMLAPYSRGPGVA